jgi:hypothetical protein
MPDISDDLPDDEELREVRDAYVALSIMDEAALRQPPPLILSDLVAFLAGDLRLSEQQQEFLFSNQRMLAEFQSLVEKFKVPRRQRRPGTGDAEIAQLRAAAASADETPRYRIIDGGSWRLYHHGENERLLTIKLDRSFALTPSFLLLEDQEPKRRRLAKVDLRHPEPSFASGINVILRTDNPEHLEQLRILPSLHCREWFLQ